MTTLPVSVMNYDSLTQAKWMEIYEQPVRQVSNSLTEARVYESEFHFHMDHDIDTHLHYSPLPLRPDIQPIRVEH